MIPAQYPLNRPARGPVARATAAVGRTAARLARWTAYLVAFVLLAALWGNVMDALGVPTLFGLPGEF